MSHETTEQLVLELNNLIARQTIVWSKLCSHISTRNSYQLKFNKAQRKITWRGGSITFISRAERRFEIIRALWKRPHKRMLEYRLAEKFFNDDDTSSATIRTALRRIAIDLRKANCPYVLRYNTKGAWLDLK